MEIKVTRDENTIALVARDEGEMVAQLFLVILPHLEGLWIKPKYRGRLLMRQMEEVMIEEMKDLGVSKVFAFSIGDFMSDYLMRRGYSAEPYQVFSKEID